jgi:alkaline phosphatase
MICGVPLGPRPRENPRKVAKRNETKRNEKMLDDAIPPGVQWGFKRGTAGFPSRRWITSKPGGYLGNVESVEVTQMNFLDSSKPSASVLRRRSPKLLLVSMLAFMFTFSTTAVGMAQASCPTLKNVVLFIGDGMGDEHIKAAGLFRFGEAYDSSDATRFAWEKTDPFFHRGSIFPKAFYLTDSYNVENEQHPWSGSTATAIASGVITINNVVGVDKDGNPVDSVLELYQGCGKAVGLVSNATITHATPAAFAAHHDDRGDQDIIGQQYLNKVPQSDVLLGGAAGGISFPTDPANKGYATPTDRTELGATVAAVMAGTETKAWGQFSDSGFPYMADAQLSGDDFYDPAGGNKPTVSEMAVAAIQMLKKIGGDDGFFLMVEHAQIDWAAHEPTSEANNSKKNTVSFVRGMVDINDLSAAVEGAVSELEDQKGNSIIAITADHETGGLMVTDEAYATTTGADYIGECDFSDYTSCFIPNFDYVGSTTVGYAHHTNFNIGLYVWGGTDIDGLAQSTNFVRDQVDLNGLLKGEVED